MAIGPAWPFTADTISAVVTGATTSATRIGLSCVTSLTTSGSPASCDGGRRMVSTSTENARVSGSTAAASPRSAKRTTRAIGAISRVSLRAVHPVGERLPFRIGLRLPVLPAGMEFGTARFVRQRHHEQPALERHARQHEPRDGGEVLARFLVGVGRASLRQRLQPEGGAGR